MPDSLFCKEFIAVSLADAR